MSGQRALPPSGGRAMHYQWLLSRLDGRINRARYWLATLIIFCCMLFAVLVLAVIGVSLRIGDSRFTISIFVISASIHRAGYDASSAASLFPRIATIPLNLVFAWFYAVASIKRLHDCDKSGWWIVPFLIIPGLNGQFGDRLGLGDTWVASCLDLASGILLLCGFIRLGFLKGTGGPNRFGPDPLAPDSKAVLAGPGWDQFSELEIIPASAGPSAASHVKRGP
jgi:uncharacterized membrane protein YhaH (DUF805 family)